jgi:hypothetical protein
MLITRPVVTKVLSCVFQNRRLFSGFSAFKSAAYKSQSLNVFGLSWA